MSQLQETWDLIRKDSHPKRWMIARANEKATELELVASGETGFEDFIKHLSDTHGIVQAGIRIAAVDERGAVRSIRYKFIRVVMITSDVSAMKRAKANNVKAAADSLFHGTHATFDIAEASELTKDIIVTKLHNSAGAHQPNHYEFEPTAESSPAKAAAVDVPEPGANETQPSPNDGSAAAAAAEPPAQPAPPAPAPAPREDVSIADAWRRILDDKESINWLVASYDGKDVATAELVRAGCGDLASFRAVFDDSRVMFGGFRCSAIDNSGSVKSVRAKLIFVSFIGQNVKSIARAKAGSARSHFEGIINGAHISVNISEADELKEEDLIQRLQLCAGAHKPNAYDFSGKKRSEDF